MMNTVNLKDLPLAAKAIIVWGFFWRGLVSNIGSFLCSAVLGGIAGVILRILNFPEGSAIYAGLTSGIICGVYFGYLYIRWMLESQIGNFKLVLTRVSDES